MQATKKAEPAGEVRLKGFDRFVRRRMKNWGVSGCAVGIVRAGRTIYAKGFGLRDAARRLPATERTLFCVRSLTKAFTATAVGMLVDDGLLEWDVPLREYLPSFRMHDALATERATVRDLLTHRTGLPPHYTALFTSLATEAGILERLPHLEPYRDFRSGARYTNVTYAAAGALIERLSGMTWQEFLRTRIFDPLGMTDSTFATAELFGCEELAVGHRQGRNGPVPWLRGRGFSLSAAHDPKAPAAAVVSNVPDMCRWLAFQMNGGKVGERSILSAGILREIHSSQMCQGQTVHNRALSDASYAMGWLVQPYRGYRRLWHSGGGHGYRAVASFMPWESVGVVVLANLGPTWLPHIIQFNVHDRLLGLSQLPWNRQYKRMDEGQAARVRRQRRARRRKGRAGPPRPLQSYAGQYEHPGYGRLSVSLERGRLRMRYNGIGFSMRNCHGDVFDITGRHEDPLEMKASFRTDPAGQIDSVAIPFEPTVTDIIFKKQVT